MNKLSRMPIFIVYAAVLICIAAAMSACNAQKKNTAAARQYTGFITRYNILYNGDTHFKETLKDMETKYEDDYTSLVFMHPVEAKSVEKAPQPSGDFTRSIEKAQKAIQIRSIKKKPEKKSGKGNDPKYKEWMKRDEYNPVMQNAWMLMGESQYYNGDFLGAASTFYYISKHFTWLPNVVTEAKLWQARSYLSLDWLYEAEMIVTRIKPEELTTKGLVNLYNFTYADFLVKSKEYEKAIPYLEKAINGVDGAQKTRLRFLLGQVYAKTGQKEKAYQAFKKAGSSSSAPYRTKFNARIKQSEVFSGSNIEPEVKALKRMVKYDRNKDYLDQIYYAIGNLYLSRQDTLNAIENYELATSKSTRGGIEKAIPQITLGTLYFERHNYAKAQPCYSEAISQLPKTYPDYPLLKRRADVLDELAVYSENVNLQDSLLHLASLPEDQLLAVIDKIIEDLKKKEKEEAEAAAREEYMAKMSANQNNLVDKNQRDFNINSDNSWYFYNPTSKSSGKTEFQKRWGSRKLEDDWRRRNKTVFNTADFDDADSEVAENEFDLDNDSIKAEKEALEAANDPHQREFYLAQIPKTDEEKATSNEIIQDGLYNMGIILKDKLEDFPAALNEFNRLLSDYPDNVYRLDVYYNLYLMFMRNNDPAQAEIYRKLILSDFADSKYGIALQDPNYIENLRRMDAVQNQLYEQTYEDYLNNQNQTVHQAYDTMMETYPMSPLMPKFMFLDALAYVTENNAKEFNAVLREMLERYPQTDLAPIASSWLKGMAQGRELHASADGSNMRGMLWDIHLSNDSTAFSTDSLVNFELNDDAAQVLVLVYSTDAVSSNALLYEVARHNFNSFVVKDFDLELMNFGRLGMLVIKGFENLKELNHYRSVMTASESFRLPAEVTPIPISEDNFQKLLNQGRTFDDYFRFLQKQNYEGTQSELLDPDEVETIEEADAAERATGDLGESDEPSGSDVSDEFSESDESDEINESDEHSEQAEDNDLHEINAAAPQLPDAQSPAVTAPASAVQLPDAQSPAVTAPASAVQQPDAQSPAVTAPASAVQQPVPKPAVSKPAQPVVPAELPEGSEGDDDPLLQ